MIQFKKLRLSGFKSFVEKTELEIGPGLTGIVGPNGCGKSNLVEALRWVMGVSSAKAMRSGAGGMEDVIFNGTSTRPARNHAEVSLLIDNTSHSAPAAYNGDTEIEVIRKIEKDHGSLYKVNGKTVRARDVQMLFADTATGPTSPALVSQGRVTAMINAKPQERRQILEESAGVSGLYVRRHEAELRLRAADQNLQRLQDLVGSMESRMNALRKQTRQAAKYKSLSAEIRQAEMSIAWLEWRILHNRIASARHIFAEAESQVATHMATVTQLTKTQNSQAEDLPALRKTEAETAAALQSHKLTLQRLEDQERDLDQQLSEAKAQMTQLLADRAHEQNALSESSVSLERMQSEEQNLVQSQGREEETMTEKTQIKTRLEEKVLGLESEYEAFMKRAAEAKANRQGLERQKYQDESRLKSTQDRLTSLQSKLDTLSRESEDDQRMIDLRQDMGTLESDVAQFRTDLTQAEEKLAQARAEAETARSLYQEHDKKKGSVETEIKTLQSVLNTDTQGQFKPILDDVQPDKGFETALSRALGDTLTASTDGDAPVIWLDRDYGSYDFPALPAGVSALSPHVRAPHHLKAALAFIGVVDTEDQGIMSARDLKPGQSIVSRAGAYWRWDGLHIKSSASDRHSLSLQQKNRLMELVALLPALVAQAENAESAYHAATQARDQAQKSFDDLTQTLRTTEQNLRTRQNELNRLTEQGSARMAERAKLEEGIGRSKEDIESLSVSITESSRALDAYDQATLEKQNLEIESLRSRLVETRDSLREAVRELDSITQEQSRRKARLHAIMDERLNLQNRTIRSRERLKELDDREIILKDKLQTLETRPSTLSADRAAMLEKISIMELARTEAADRLAVVENELAETSRALKEAERLMGEAREVRAGSHATVAAGEAQMTEIISHIREQFDLSPEEVGLECGMSAQAEESLPELEPFKSRREKMVRERDMIGPVNLRADVEADELEKELCGILEERNDLVQAIEELREGINKLNKEAKERLNAAFDHVNGHFKDLFKRLYGGGQAELKLLESDDPLQSGLEIFAQPPGKTLQSLSLLSGGEQTLASIALIFAMFLTNPSPICVLDEIDAPLDDANVDRVCDLLDEIAERGETRFLIITHHRLTMARMDRLYGVTMAERGVSQLVSVDLNKQMDFLEAAE
ncbi:MAG: chromosome segregation protein SMC [Alphaproteobacteria bacterium]|nr:chromosome segregation protein SMC [Alphaproteobacteria bacterium]